MADTSARPADEIEKAVHLYGNTLYRICLSMLGNAFDAEDAVSESFLSYIKRASDFNSPEHERAWLIRVAVNKCRDRQRYSLKHPYAELDSIANISEESTEELGVIEALFKLPEKFRVALVLHYVEGYSVKEIAGMIGKTQSAVKMRLKKGRTLLEDELNKGEKENE